MKLITLNTWGGKRFSELKEFIDNKKEQTDIFCFQEVYSTTSKKDEFEEYRVNLYSEFRDLLSEFTGEMAARGKGYLYFDPVDFDLSYGLATFLRPKLNLEEFSDEIVCTKVAYDGREVPVNVQITRLEGLTILNLHGVWIKDAHKIDTPERIEQSETLKKITEQERSDGREVILCGDFNLKPDTESLKIIESSGLRNLVTEYGVTDTRTKFYDKDVRFADYILVSDGIEVKEFQVLPDVVSDHTPLYLEFDITADK